MYFMSQLIPLRAKILRYVMLNEHHLPRAMETSKRVFTNTNRWQSHMHWLQQRVLSAHVDWSYLFAFPVTRIRISVKFRKVPRENETVMEKISKACRIPILLYLIQIFYFSNLCCVAFYQKMNTTLYVLSGSQKQRVLLTSRRAY